MNNIYLKYHELKTRMIHEDKLDNINLNNDPYIYYDQPYYKLRDNVFIGSIDRKENFGFLRQIDSDDIYIDGYKLKNVMHNDVILIKDEKDPKVEFVLTRNLTEIIATVKKVKKGYRYYTDRDINRNIILENDERIVEGHVLRLKVLEIRENEITTSLIEIIGHINDPDIDIKKIVAYHKWPEPDMKKLEDEISNIKIDYDLERLKRHDLTNEFVFTIDGADAKDLDDAISLKYENGNYHLGVHIADVSHFVTEGTLLDESAFEKATSVYMANKVIPMLPPKLSNDLCSLNPDEEKLTLSCLMEIDKNGKVVAYDIQKTIIKSSYRLTYDSVNDYIYDNISLENKTLNKKIDLMLELSDILKTMRKKRGEIEFDSEEIKFDIVNNEVKEVYAKHTFLAEELIESFMLAANETIAFHMEHAEIPSIYRVHESPDTDKLKEAITKVSRLGVKVNQRILNNPSELQTVLESVKEKDNEFVVNMTILRAMQRAKYSKTPIGHFGLAARHYTHFTSPIRRYPDLILHRIIKDLVFAETPNLINKLQYYENNIEDIAEHSSVQERIAIDIERDVNKLMACKYLNNKIGQKFNGQIIQMLKSGMFVRLDNGIEGFIPMRDNYRSTYFDVDLLTYRANNDFYKLGQKIKVELKRVDLLELEIDFSIDIKKKKQRRRRNR